MNSRHFAVIGHPIGHTMSPFLNTRLFEMAGLPGDYTVRDIPPENLTNDIQSLKSLNGFNITIPHKQAIIPLLNELSEKARFFHSVNTVKNENGYLTGYTTDSAGFLFALKSAGVDLSGNVLVLGNGGVSRVMALEALMAGCRVYIAGRDLQKASALAEELEQTSGKKSHCLLLSETDTFAKENNIVFDLAVNGTPLGMYPKTGVSPLDENALKHCKAVFDAVYNPGETEFLKLAKKLGLVTVGGMPMLVGQAAEAHRIWDGSVYSTADLLQLCAEAEIEMQRIFGGK